MEALFSFTKSIIESYGYAGIFTLTTLEQFIFPIPADIFITMGSGAGLIFSKILLLVLAGALTGSMIGYLLGRTLGHPMACWLFGKKRVDKGEKFIQKWGILGVIVAGITPLPFKIVTWMAGIFEMPFWRFILGVIIGRMPRYIITAYAGTLIYQKKLALTPEISAVILGSLQGVTEFLPISSSGHLVIMEHFLKLPVPAAQMLSFDIFLHGGSLMAIVFYFWKDWTRVFKELWGMLKKKRIETGSVSFMLAIGTIPAIIAGLTLGDLLEGPLRNLHSVAIFFILVSGIFFYVSWKEKKFKLWSRDINPRRAVLIGCAQALALIPGVSRAGSTIAAGIFMGIPREKAARFSFMLGGIAILAANLYTLLSLGEAPLPDVRFTLLGFFSAFAVSLGAIAVMLSFLQKHSLRAFAIYLLVAGMGLLSFF